MPQGSNKGEKRGGRQKGTLNKRTVAKILETAKAIEDRKLSGRRLAVEVLDDFMHVTADLAAFYRPALPGQPKNRNESPEKFWQCLQAAGTFAKYLAPYQSPTYRAIIVAPAPPTGQPEQRKRFSLTIFEGGRPGPAAVAEVTPLRNKAG